MAIHDAGRRLRGLMYGFVAFLPCAFCCAISLAQTDPQQAQTFDAASVRENLSGKSNSVISTASNTRLEIINVPLRFIVLYAYKLQDHELAGTPQWARERNFDVKAIYPQEHPTDEQIRVMLQSLLKERFGLVTHHESKQVSGFLLESARSDKPLGPQLREVDDVCPASGEQKPDSDQGREALPKGSQKETVQRPRCAIIATRSSLRGEGARMKELASTLQSMVGRPVFDRTGLTGRYHMAMTWTPTDLTSGVDSSNDDRETLFSALPHQLGLKLATTREYVDVLVIDHLQRPTIE
jgi:uncharacterized protein (TIGR03435 family)